MRARIGTAFTAAGREAEVEHHRRDRHRDVHRQRLAPGCRPRRRGSGARAGRAARSRRARPRARGSARRAGRAAGEPGGRSRAPCRRRRGSHARSARRPPPVRRRRATLSCASSSSRAHASDVPRMTGPQPRIPAATAPCSDPGSAASVMRAATLVGIIPCSAIATSSRSRKKRWSSVGSRPVSSRWKYSVKLSLPIRSPAQVASPHLDPVGIGLADVADGRPGLTDLHADRPAAARPPPRLGRGFGPPASRRRYGSHTRPSSAARPAASPALFVPGRVPGTKSAAIRQEWPLCRFFLF